MTKNQKPAHITVEGVPICLCEGHYAGLIGPASPIPTEHQKCGFKSLAAAKRAKAEMQKHRYGVRVVPGPCPVDD